MRRRARTCEAPRAELDMMVLEFTTVENSGWKALGKSMKEMRWRVAAQGTPSLEIELKVEKNPLADAEVGILCDGQKIFPSGASERGKLTQNFEHKWPFRGAVQSLTKKDFFEIKPKSMGDNWFPAEKITQRKDGLFEAHVWLPDGEGGAKQMVLPAVKKEDIREEYSKDPIEIPMRNVVLNVKKADPVNQTTLTLVEDDNEDLITHYFARPTPPPGKGAEAIDSLPVDNAIRMEVTKDRKQVTTSVSHTALEKYLASEVWALDHTVESKIRTQWTLNIGPYAEHTIMLEKVGAGHTDTTWMKGGGGIAAIEKVAAAAEIGVLTQSKIVNLVVDGKTLVQAAAEDLDIDEDESSGCPWECKFRFIGERSIKFKVYETNSSGSMLESTDIVEGLRKDQIKFTKVCKLIVPDLADLSSASLEIDDVGFCELKPRPHQLETDQDLIVCDPKALEMQYNVIVPSKIRDVAWQERVKEMNEKLQVGGAALAEGGAALAEQIKAGWTSAAPAFQKLGGYFSQPVAQPAESQKDEDVSAVAGMPPVGAPKTGGYDADKGLPVAPAAKAAPIEQHQL